MSKQAGGERPPASRAPGQYPQPGQYRHQGGYGQQPYQLPYQQQRANAQQQYVQQLQQRSAPDPDRRRRMVGLALYIIAILIGIVLNIAFQFLEVFSAKNPGQMAGAVMTAAIFASLPLPLYLSVPPLLCLT